MPSDPRLKRIYRRINRRHFSGELPDETVIHFGTPSENDEAELFWEEPRVIVINNVMLAMGWWNAIEQDLVHEMVHLKLKSNQCDSKPFFKEMLRLARAGALRGLW